MVRPPRLDGFLHRSWLKSSGVTDAAFRGRPVIGICNSWSELVNCNVHLRGLAEAVKRGVCRREVPARVPGHVARGVADEADDDALPEPDGDGRRGVHSLVPARRGRPADRLRQDEPGEHPRRGQRGHSDDRRHRRADAQRRWRGREIGSCSDCWHYHEELRAGRITSRTGSRSRTPCPARTVTA